MSIFSATLYSFLQFNISIKSIKLSIHTTSIPSTIDASETFSFGINILLNQFSFAQIVAGNTPETFLSFPSSDNSPINILLSSNFLS